MERGYRKGDRVFGVVGVEIGVRGVEIGLEICVLGVVGIEGEEIRDICVEIREGICVVGVVGEIVSVVGVVGVERGRKIDSEGLAGEEMREEIRVLGVEFREEIGR